MVVLSPGPRMGLILLSLAIVTCPCFSFKLVPPPKKGLSSFRLPIATNDAEPSRRALLLSPLSLLTIAAFAEVAAFPQPVQAVKDEETWSVGPDAMGWGKASQALDEDGEYVSLTDKEAGGWTESWKQRLDKASTMSSDEIFMAARGAGNVSAEEPVSPAARKRRALAGCRDGKVRERASSALAVGSGGFDERACTGRVLGGDAGDIDAMLAAFAGSGPSEGR